MRGYSDDGNRLGRAGSPIRIACPDPNKRRLSLPVEVSVADVGRPLPGLLLESERAPYQGAHAKLFGYSCAFLQCSPRRLGVAGATPLE